MNRELPKALALEDVVLERIRRELERLDCEVLAADEIIRSIQHELNAPELSLPEKELLLKLRVNTLGGGTDEVARVLAHRVRGALEAGLRQAAELAGLGPVPPVPTVYVVRRETQSSEAEHSAQFTGVFEETHAELARMAANGSWNDGVAGAGLFVLAEEEVFDRLRSRILESRGKRSASVAFFERDGAESLDGFTHVPARIEVVRIEGEETSLELRMIALLRGSEGLDSQSSDVAPDVLVGTLFHDKYRIVRRIGAGGFGAVYEATDERGAGNRVAIKVMHTDRETIGGLSAFKDEARRVTRLNHPNIVDWKVFDETPEGTQYLVMELLEGEELDRIIANEGRIEPLRAARILLEVVDALRAAHEVEGGRSVLHLDLKPRNVFIVSARGLRDELVKVFDFGIGQFVGGEEEEEVPEEGASASPDDLLDFLPDVSPSTLTFAAALNAPRMLIDEDGKSFRRCVSCTPEYASPEQCAHIMGAEDMVALDGRSDVYSLGVAAFLMLTGEYPFPRPLIRVDLLRIHREERFQQLTGYDKRIPKPLARWVDRCMAKDREDRYGDANEAYHALRAFVEPSPWKGALPILIPLAVTIVALLLWLAPWKGRPVPGFLPEDGLILGPSRVSALMSIEGVQDVDALPPPGTLVRVLRERTEIAIPGLMASVESEGRVLLRVDPDWSPPEGRDTVGVQLRFDAGRVFVDPFELTWIAENAWSVAKATIGERDLDLIGGRRVDPDGLELEVFVVGRMRGQVTEVVLSTPDGASVPGLDRSSGERRVFTFRLADLGLPEGPAELILRARDAADGVVQRTVTLLIDHTDLALQGTASLVDRGQAGAPLSAVANRYRVTDDSAPALSLSSNGIADLIWWIVVDLDRAGADGVTGRSEFLVPIDSLAELSGGDSYEGHIEFELSDAAYVVRANPLPLRGRVDFEYSNARAGFVATVGGGALRSDTPNFVSQSRLTIDRVGGASMRLDVAVFDEWGRPFGTPQASNRLRNVSTPTASFALELPDGRYGVRVQAFQYSTSGDTATKPDQDEVFELVVDTEGDVVVLEGLDARVLRAGDRLESVLARVVSTLPDSSPVELELAIVGSAVRCSFTGIVPDNAPVQLELDELWPGADVADGVYTVRVSGRDEAGNGLASVDVEVEVARHGPVVDLKRPTRGLWSSDENGTWKLDFLATDANGVRGATCQIVSAGRTLTVALAPQSSAPAPERSFRGSIEFPYDWSGQRVHVLLTVDDARGNSTRVERGEGFVLSDIELPRPARIAVRMNAPVEDMRLVPGNTGFNYLFRGIGDRAENAISDAAGIRRFNHAAAVRSWALEYSSGTIADYYLDENEVRFEQFLAFLRARDGWNRRALWIGEWPGETRRSELERKCRVEDRLSPVTGVSWDEAWAYARWVGKRLPSWVEWEFCVRGGQRYKPFAGYHDGAVLQQTRREWALADRTDGGIRGLCSGAYEWTSSPLSFHGERRSSRREWDEIARDNPAGLLAPERADLARSEKFWWVGGPESDSFDFAWAYSGNRNQGEPERGFRCALSLKDYRATLTARSRAIEGERHFDALDD